MKVDFKISIGHGVSINSGYASIYRIEESSAKPIKALEIAGNAFSLELEDAEKVYPYYYIVFAVYDCTINGTAQDLRGNGIELVAVFNPSSGTIGVNPHTAVAALFAFAQMNTQTGTLNIHGTPRSIRIAYGMKNNLVFDNGDILRATAKESAVITRPPNGLETNSYRLFNFLCNLFYYYSTDPATRDQLNDITYSTGNKNFTNCMMSIVQQPFANVPAIYNLLNGKTAVFEPSLAGDAQQPGAWAIAIKFNDSGSGNFLISGTAFVVFDENDRAWIANNFRQGTPDSATHCIVLEADGKPAPFSPLTGGGILGAGFGMAVNNKKDRIAIGNFGWGSTQNNPLSGSVSLFTSAGVPLSPVGGYTESTSRVQGMCYDKDDNLWISSWGTQDPMAPAPPGVYNTTGDQYSSITVYPKGYGTDPAIRAVSFTDFYGSPNPHYGTFDVVMDSEGYGIVSCAGSGKHKVCSSVNKMQLTKDSAGNYTLKLVQQWVSDLVYQGTADHPGYPGFEDLRQVQVAPDGHVYVGGLLTGRIIVLGPDLSYKGEIKSPVINAAWGIKIDKKGTMYVANFGTGQGNEPLGIAVLDPANPDGAQLLTLPTGGEEVRLASGQPLYGNDLINNALTPCYSPLMRLTSTNIDGAGNLWAMNNWKPSVYIDISMDISTNPGGDGVIVFLGIAIPE